MTGRYALVFDLGGVLVDWNPRYLYRRFFPGDEEAMERFLEEIGFQEWNIQQDKGRTLAEGVAELSARFPQYRDLIRAYDEFYEESLAGAIQPTVDILLELKNRGWALYALSNWPGEKFHAVRHKFPFLNWFQAIVISGDAKLCKPDPRIFQLLLDKIGRPASECIFIDDATANIAVARELGFITIRYESPEQLRAKLQEMGVFQSPPLPSPQ